ncbi:MAG: PEP/pyruvate-binding domain-containing protein [Oscillospiraceae bacterium]|nr:PEP/pyruvate-binding domain-containing protein [Oscillospiraceae bacterium]
MDEPRRISTGIDGLDRAVDYLRSGDTVLWQIEHIGDYIFAATRFVSDTARGGQRIVYLRFGEHEEVIDAQALAERGANVKKYDLDPSVGFETFAVQVHRIIAKEGTGVFYIFDCITDLQKYWFSDLMVCNFFCLTCPFLVEQSSIAYVPILYEKHIYETVSRIRHAAPLLLNIRTVNAATYIHAVKVDGRHGEYMYFPIKIEGGNSTLVTSSAESYGIFDIFTQTGERRDCWDSMFDFAAENASEPEDEEALARKDNIIRCLLGNEPQRFELCRKYFSTEDLIRIKKREIGTGCIGGKSVGMLLARQVLRSVDPVLYAKRVEEHDSYFIGADVFYTYFVQNGAWGLRTRMVNVEDYLEVAEPIREKLLTGEFSHSIKEQFRSMLEYFGQSPIIVRSSSILEDGFGNAFAGKYESVFCPNQGTPEERYAEFEAAVKTVYASTVNEDAIRYRADRGLLSRDEQMALLVMRVSGDIHGDYYYPHIAGVGHSQNLYVTDTNQENKGMIRLVFGMGTRAVDREADDYARLLDMAKPLAPPRVAYGDEYKFSQHKADVIDLKNNCFTTVPIDTLNKADLKTDSFLFMEPDAPTRARFREMGITDYPVPDIVNFDKLLRRTDFVDVMTKLMKDLADRYSYPVDVEFACNFRPDREYSINLLQCRPLQTRGLGQQGVKPKVKDYYFRINGNFMGGNMCLPVRYAVMVKVEEYLDLPEQKKYNVARCIGRLNELLRDEHTILLGPGRWGTTTPSLGVPVNYTEVSKYDCMCELAYSSHGLRPELSYGSHFFQDLVEAGTFYTAIYRGEYGCEFNDDMLLSCENRYTELMGTYSEPDMEKVIHVCDLGESAILYSEIASQECFLARI